jgi:cation diffusion facilitator family transporter
MAEGTRRTVLVALAANLAVGVAKGVGGVISGSSSLLSEAAHSVADTFNEIFLLLSIGRSQRPADREHPFGYGKERFFWSLLAAVGIFVSGAGFSLYQGLSALLGTAEEPRTRDFVIVYAVLGVTLVLEGASLRTALRQVRAEAARARRRPLAFIRASFDPTVKTVASEDTAAVVGVLMALVGTVLHQVTGNEDYDAAGSLAIAALLAWVAYSLGRNTRDLLIGVAADPVVRLTVAALLHDSEHVADLKQLLTLQMGPDTVIVAARVAFVDDLGGAELASVCSALDRRIRDQLPEVAEVFLDPSRVDEADRERGRELLALTTEELRSLEGDDALDRLRQRVAEKG